MTELCERYGVSRPTGYKWMARRKGGAGFADRSHAPHQCPHRTSADVEALIVAARQEYGWGAKKLRQVLRTRSGTRRGPGRRAVPSMRSSIGTRCSTRIGDDANGRTLARPRSTLSAPTKCGPWISKASSERVMVATVIP